ncbi:MAG: neutral trehalase [Alphaproteobacteria bacterium]|nr:neutral trehalase [Alphaproteobacteria bacterium]|tara:strand:+ start:1320 stop:2624 length:1305 start_codon:yes stop_codon:yes gene_type:complete
MSKEVSKQRNVLRDEALYILKTNSRDNRYTVPSDRLYPYQWNWDSGFIALGIATYDFDRAVAELESLMEGQWHNGMVPHIVFHEFEEHYAPGPLDWQVPTGTTTKADVCTSGITQPPIMGSVLWRLYERCDNRDDYQHRFNQLYTQIKAYHDWFMGRRTSAPSHDLVKCLHPWESGMDNLPNWDKLVDEVPRGDTSQFRRKDLKGDNASQRPHDSDYQAYMSLVYHYRAIGYDSVDLLPQAHFKVYDLVLNSLLLRSAHDMALLAQDIKPEHGVYWQGQIQTLTQGLQKLWSEEHHAFLSDNAVDSTPLLPITCASFLPLFARAANESQAQQLADLYRDWRDVYPYSVPTTDPRSSKFEMERYWRGPIWINTNWMIAEGFKAYGFDDIAEEIRNDSRALIEQHGFYEYFTPNGAKGLGASQFSWSAALALYWLF